jgi:hypothetical protein
MVGLVQDNPTSWMQQRLAVNFGNWNVISGTPCPEFNLSRKDDVILRILYCDLAIAYSIIITNRKELFKQYGT